MNLIKNRTKITKKEIIKFLQQASLKNLWLVAICAVIVALLGFSFENGVIMYRNYIFLILAGAVFVVYFIILSITLSKQTKNFNIIENEYSFNDDGLIVVGSTGGVTESFNVKYEMLFKVKETKESYYFFINDYSALIISKSEDCFSRGDAIKLKKLLELKLNPKQNQLKKSISTK